MQDFWACFFFYLKLVGNINININSHCVCDEPKNLMNRRSCGFVSLLHKSISKTTNEILYWTVEDYKQFIPTFAIKKFLTGMLILLQGLKIFFSWNCHLICRFPDWPWTVHTACDGIFLMLARWGIRRLQWSMIIILKLLQIFLCDL